MQKPFMVRQGDVLLVQVEAIPPTAIEQPRDAGRVILAYGEVTGHAHAICEPDVIKLADGIAEYLNAPTGACIRHEEHAPLDVPAGKFRIVHQVEYTPAAIRRVAD
jgi:hypothetical protein